MHARADCVESEKAAKAAEINLQLESVQHEKALSTAVSASQRGLLAALKRWLLNQKSSSSKVRTKETLDQRKMFSHSVVQFV